MSRKALTLCLFCLAAGLAWAALSTQPVYAAGPIYVKPHGNGNGSSWAAAAGLQAALGSAANGDEIWVASGIYTPGVTSAPPSRCRRAWASMAALPEPRLCAPSAIGWPT